MGTKTVQELENQRIVDAAIKYTPEGNNGHHLYEYGSAKHREHSRLGKDSDGNGRKGLDCSSLVYSVLKDAHFNIKGKMDNFATRSLFEGSVLQPMAKKNFEILPPSSRNNGSLKPGDLIMMHDRHNSNQHIVIFKNYDEKGRIHFIGSQSSTGPAEAILTGYWDKKFTFLGALRPKESFIKPEYSLKNADQSKVNEVSSVNQADKMQPQQSFHKAKEHVNITTHQQAQQHTVHAHDKQAHHHKHHVSHHHDENKHHAHHQHHNDKKPVNPSKDMFNQLVAAYSAGFKDALSIVDHHQYANQRCGEVKQLAQQQEQLKAVAHQQQQAESLQVEQPKRTMRMA